MIIVKTPLRISFFGGGSDFPKWYLKNSGEVISAGIDKYTYVSIRKLPNLFSYKYRLRYFNNEYTYSINEIKHPTIKAILKQNVETYVEIQSLSSFFALRMLL